MKIAVLGVGAIGGLIGGYLTRAGYDITLIDMWPANIERINDKGLTITALEEEFTVNSKAVHLGEVSSINQRFDIVVISVKSYDTAWSSKFIEPYLAPNGFIISAQNSINDKTIAAQVGWNRIVGCVVTLGAGMYKPGHVERTTASDRHCLTLGEASGLVTPRINQICEVMSAIGPTSSTNNIWGERWAKLAVNCMSNAVSGFTGLKSAEIRENANTRALSIRIAAELVEVATALGISVEPISKIPGHMYIDAIKNKATMEEVERRLIDGAGELRE